jgi:hypothetical protein
MALFDKVKSQAAGLAQKAQEAGKAGQAKIDEVQARRKNDANLRELGAAYFATRQGRADADTAATIERLVEEIAAFEADGGVATSDADEPEAGDFKLD